ncbi:MAG: hypothetical protein WC833_11430 [Bacteroidales bacterium]|jgi:hypothetical protein
MFKVVTTLFLFSLLIKSPQPGPGDLEIRLINDKRKEMAAGFTSNVLITLLNNSDTIKEVNLKLNTSGYNWKKIENDSSIQIQKKSSLNKIISIYIPENTRAGDYSVELMAFDANGSRFGIVSIPIYVKPRYEIIVEKQKAPTYLFSDDSLGVGFRIRNLSNIDIMVTSSIINGRIIENRNFKIPIDSSILTKVSVSVPQNLYYYTKQNISLSASVNEKPDVESSASYLIDIIPSGKVKFDGYNRFPLKVTGIFATNNRMEKRDYGIMLDIVGSGLISEKKSRRLEFHLRGPDRGGNPTLGLSDEYYLNYTSSHTKISIGDNNYRLSDLTESSRSGRGIELQQSFGKFSVGSFFHFPRYYPEIKNIFAIYTDYKINQKIRLSAGYLNKSNTKNEISNLLSISGIINPFSWGYSEFELAMGKKPGQTTKAYKFSVNINKSIFASHFNITHADPGFSGYVSNSSYLSSGITANLKKKMSISLNYDINRSNLTLDTIYTNAPYSKNINLMTNYRMSANNSIGFGAYIITMEDRAPNPIFNYKKYNGRVSFQSKFKRVSINFQAELGKIINNLGTKNGELTDFYNGCIFLRYSFNESVSATGFLNYQGGKQYLLTSTQRFYYGGTLQASIRKKTQISFDYRNNYEMKEYYRDRSLLSLQIHQKINSNHEFELGANYNLLKNSLNKKELSMQIRYTYTINIPLSKKKDVGSLTGKVIDMGVGQVNGVILNLNGDITMTDKNGNFEFPMVKVGTYILAIDESSTGLNAIACIPGPYLIKIAPGRETQFELSLTRAARIKGRLVIREDETSGKKGFFPVKEEIENLIIEASNGSETFRTLTYRDGTFNFDDLRPGSWYIKIYPNGIPQGYKLDKDQFILDLTLGKEENLDVIIFKKAREIKLQNTF